MESTVVMKTTVKKRKDGQSITNWLLSTKLRQENKTSLKGTNVYCPSLLSQKEFTLSTTDYDKSIFRLGIIPKPITIECKCNCPGIMDDGGCDTSGDDDSNVNIVDNDDSCIRITKEDIWNVIIDFDNYYKWNPFQNQIRILEKAQEQQQEEESSLSSTTLSSDDCNVIYEMDVVPFGKTMTEIYYVDEERHILIYGLPNGKSARCQWLTTTSNTTTTSDDDNKDCITNITYHSVDFFLYGIEMYIVWLIPFLQKFITCKFNEQHIALKERVIQLAKDRKKQRTKERS